MRRVDTSVVSHHLGVGRLLYSGCWDEKPDGTSGLIEEGEAKVKNW